MGSFLAGSSCGVKGRALPDGGRAATLPEAPPSQVRPGRGARFRTTVLCPGRAARPLLSGRKAGKAHRDTCRGRHGLSGSCEGTAALWGASPARYPVRDRPPCRCRGKASAREFVVAQSAIVHGRGRPCSGAWPWTSASVRHSPCRGRL